MNMLTPALLYFQAVAQEGTLTDAAEKLHVSASAISRQINKLESSLGTPLFKRHARGVELTEAGRLLLAYVRRAEAEGAAVREELLVSMQRKTRTLRVACAEGFARVGFRQPSPTSAASMTTWNSTSTSSHPPKGRAGWRREMRTSPQCFPWGRSPR